MSNGYILYNYVHDIVGSGLGGSSSARSHDLSSDVTVQSCDSWGGLAPPTRVQAVPSDTVSIKYQMSEIETVDVFFYHLSMCMH